MRDCLWIIASVSPNLILHYDSCVVLLLLLKLPPKVIRSDTYLELILSVVHR